MVAVYQTAYPRLKKSFSQKDLEEFYTPNKDEETFAQSICKRSSTSYWGLLLQLKMVQRLGRFVTSKQIPRSIKLHVKTRVNSSKKISELNSYFQSGTKDRHIKKIRNFLKLQPYIVDKTDPILLNWSLDAAKTKQDLADIINVALERLIKDRYELPTFYHIERICKTARSKINNDCYDLLVSYLTDEGMDKIGKILRASTSEQYGWSDLKQEARRPTPRKIHAYTRYLEWLSSLQEMLPLDLGLPPAKHQQFINEAKSLDLSEIKDMKTNKRVALIIILIRHQYATTLDSAAQILIKTIQKIDRSAEKKLEEYLAEHQKQTDHLVSILSGTVKIYLDKPKSVSDFDPILKKDAKSILDMCDKYMAYAGNNYLPFMIPLYQKQRNALFRSVDALNLISATEDKDILKAYEFIQHHKQRRSELISICQVPDDPNSKNIINIRWIRDKWWKFVTGKSNKSIKVTHVNKYNFELCIFERIAEELSTGDLFIPNSELYDDYREQLISFEQYKSELPEYCEQLDIVEGDKEFTNDLKEIMTQRCLDADNKFSKDNLVNIENGRLIIGKGESKQNSPVLKELELLLEDRIDKVNLLDVIITVEQWLSLHLSFGPLSDFESKIEDPMVRFVLSLFCYGTNIGPTETARSVNGITRKQIAWLNIKRTTPDRLDAAIVKVNNIYKKYGLIGYWGKGNSASADGKLWDLYEDNLLSEYHLRYGSYGGIAYYHVSDTYIALFSHFIPCGVYEAIYILDGLLNDESDFNPDTVHGDTQAQSTPVFALAYLLGIKLMPRIRNIRDLNFYKPDKNLVLENIQSLFSDPIQWDKIEKYYPDMMRVAMSIKAGKMTASTILRRFGTKNRKNKLYFAFRELGRVVRTMFLLEYITDVELRKAIQAATCKSEEFNEFANWLFWANKGKIAANLKHQQSKIIKFNHLLANIVILYNTNAMTKVFNELKEEGVEISTEHMAKFSPYRTGHLGRLGSFNLDLNKEFQPMSHKLNFE